MFTNEEYEVLLTGSHDVSASGGLEKCQAALAAHHQAMYAASYPELTNERWSGALCCGLLRTYMDNGVIVLRAESIETGQVAGYVSCSLFPRSSVQTASSDSDSKESSCPLGKFDAPDDGADENITHAKINHIIVLPAHRGKGLGRLLFNSLVSHLEKVAPKAAMDLQVVTVELNTHAMKWYWRLGFVLVQLYLDGFEMKTCKYPVMYARMRRNRRIQYVPNGQFFGDNICGKKLIVLPANEPVQKRARSDSVPEEEDFSLPSSTVVSYDAISGCHKLEDGRSIDLTDAYSRGRIRFLRPLHTVVASAGKTQWSLSGPDTRARRNGGRVPRREARVEKGDVLKKKPSSNRRTRIIKEAVVQAPKGELQIKDEAVVKAPKGELKIKNRTRNIKEAVVKESTGGLKRKNRTAVPEVPAVPAKRVLNPDRPYYRNANVKRVNCPDCNKEVSAHALKYTHKPSCRGVPIQKKKQDNPEEDTGSIPDNATATKKTARKKAAPKKKD